MRMLSHQEENTKFPEQKMVEAYSMQILWITATEKIPMSMQKPEAGHPVYIKLLFTTRPSNGFSLDTPAQQTTCCACSPLARASFDGIPQLLHSPMVMGMYPRAKRIILALK